MTSNGTRYRVIETGEIGQLNPCHCNNPVIIEFKNGIIDVFFLHELDPTTRPISNWYSTNKHGGKRREQRGRPKGMERSTIDKMLQVYRFLETQSEPVYRSAIEKAVGFNCARALINFKSEGDRITLESLGIAERLPGERRWIAWRLTELGRTEGASIIESLKRED